MRNLGLDFLVRNDAALFHIDQQHAAWLETPLLDDFLFLDRQNTGFRSQNDEIIVRHDIARRTQAVAVERRANLATVRESHRCRTVPWFHQCCMIFIERAAFIRHQLVA